MGLADCRAEAVAIARRLVGSQDAEDVVQEAIVRVLRVVERGGVIDDPRAYLRVTVRHVASDRLRVVRRESLPGELPERESRRADPQAAVELRELLDAIEGLPVRQRSALLATALSTHDQTKLAQLLETSPAGVRQLVRRARQRLRITVGGGIPWLFGRAKVLITAASASGAAHGTAAIIVVVAVVAPPNPPPAPHPPTLVVPSLRPSAVSPPRVRPPVPPQPVAGPGLAARRP
jgi:RNA polymerase sigma factor (sigma-70 family)